MLQVLDNPRKPSTFYDEDARATGNLSAFWDLAPVRRLKAKIINVSVNLVSANLLNCANERLKIFSDKRKKHSFDSVSFLSETQIKIWHLFLALSGQTSASLHLTSRLSVWFQNRWKRITYNWIDTRYWSFCRSCPHYGRFIMETSRVAVFHILSRCRWWTQWSLCIGR